MCMHIYVTLCKLLKVMLAELTTLVKNINKNVVNSNHMFANITHNDVILNNNNLCGCIFQQLNKQVSPSFFNETTDNIYHH